MLFALHVTTLSGCVPSIHRMTDELERLHKQLAMV
jgi:hypothetical protein